MKPLQLTLYILISSFSIYFLSCQTKPDKSYSKIPINLSDTKSIIRAIEPDKKYDYWACVLSNPSLTIPRTEIITGRGDIKELWRIKFTPPETGFRSELFYGYYYIVYLKNNHVSVVRSGPELINFIGKVNSLDKALLIAKIKGLDVDYSRPIGSSFKKVKNGFELHLVKFHKCPVKTEPYKVNIDSLGKLTSKSLGFYYNISNGVCED